MKIISQRHDCIVTKDGAKWFFIEIMIVFPVDSNIVLNNMLYVEIDEWCEENLGSHTLCRRASQIADIELNGEEDAMAFKLRWS